MNTNSALCSLHVNTCRHCTRANRGTSAVTRGTTGFRGSQFENSYYILLSIKRISTRHMTILQVELTVDKSLLFFSFCWNFLFLLIQLYRINANNKCPFRHNSIPQRITEISGIGFGSFPASPWFISEAVSHKWTYYVFRTKYYCYPLPVTEMTTMMIM
jgi:hypothetical protein